MFKLTTYYWLKYHANEKNFFGEVAKECYLTCKQKQLSQSISIKIQLPLFWDQQSVVPLPVPTWPHYRPFESLLYVVYDLV